MSNWIKVTAGANWEGAYLNLDQMDAIGIVPTIADPNKFALAVYNGANSTGSYGTGYETVASSVSYNSVADAEAALLEILKNTNVVAL